MEALNRLQSNITELAGMHECVVVPGLGAFIRRNLPASANKFTGEVKPAGETLFFNNAIQTEDGLLIHFRSTQLGCSYSEASELIKNEVDTLISELKSHRNCRFGALGNFFLNQDGKLFFMPSGHLNISRGSYGLPVLNIKTATQAIPTVQSPTINNLQPIVNTPSVSLPVEKETLAKKETLVTEPIIKFQPEEVSEANVVEMEIEEVHQRKNNKGIIWKVAAVLAIVSLSASALIFTQKYWQPLFDKSKNQASVVPVPSKEKVETTATVAENADTEKENSNQNTPQIVEEDNEELANIPFNEGAFREKVETKIIPAFRKELKKKRGSFYAVGGQYTSEKNAIDEIVRWKKKGIDACYGHVAGSKLIKVLLNRFSEQRDAELFVEQLPKNITPMLTVKSLTIKY